MGIIQSIISGLRNLIRPDMTAEQAAQALDKLAEANPEKLEWRTSIVDLMKLLKMDSSLANRQLLARELGYEGQTNDSAKMNNFLHQEVMSSVAEHGIKLPTERKFQIPPTGPS